MQTRKPLALFLPALALASLLALGGCEGGREAIAGPGGAPMIHNGTDDFRMQADGLSGATGIWNYTWAITGTQASIVQAGSLSGKAKLQVKDGFGHLVYQGDLTQEGTFSSTAATKGNWSLVVTLEGSSGVLDFRILRKN